MNIPRKIWPLLLARFAIWSPSVNVNWFGSGSVASYRECVRVLHGASCCELRTHFILFPGVIWPKC